MTILEFAEPSCIGIRLTMAHLELIMPMIVVSNDQCSISLFFSLKCTILPFVKLCWRVWIPTALSITPSAVSQNGCPCSEYETIRPCILGFRPIHPAMLVKTIRRHKIILQRYMHVPMRDTYCLPPAFQAEHSHSMRLNFTTIFFSPAHTCTAPGSRSCWGAA